MFELKEILAFVHVAENRSFTTAATQLNMSQPTLSKRIRDLEESLGVLLLERTTKSVCLTAAGQRFLEDARKILVQANRMELSARLESTGDRLLVAIEEELYPLACFQQAFFAACARVTGDIRPQYFGASSLTEVLSGSDVTLACSCDTIDRQRYQVTALRQQPLCVVAPRRPGYGTQLTRAQVDAELKSARVVWYPRNRSSGVPMGQIRSLSGLRHPAIEWIDSCVAALTCVQFDKGVAIMPAGHELVVCAQALSYYPLPVESGGLEIFAISPIGGRGRSEALVRELRGAFAALP